MLLAAPRALIVGAGGPVAVVILLFVSPDLALAHRPYFSQSAQFQVSGVGEVSLKLLHGDGIVFGDPVRAVIVGEDGRLRAVSPLARRDRLMVSCRSGPTDGFCVAYDGAAGRVFEPDPAS